MELKGLGLDALGGQAVGVDIGAVAALDVLDPYLTATRAVSGAAGTRVSRPTFPSSTHTSACVREMTLVSKYPLRSVGIVLALLCRPILDRWCSTIFLGWNVSLRGYRLSAGNAGGLPLNAVIVLSSPRPVGERRARGEGE